jgi:hypothetical protein
LAEIACGDFRGIERGDTVGGWQKAWFCPLLHALTRNSLIFRRRHSSLEHFPLNAAGWGRHTCDVMDCRACRLYNPPAFEWAGPEMAA